MGNGVSNDQGNLPSYGKRDVSAFVCKGQHDWSNEQAEAPETHLLSTNEKALQSYCQFSIQKQPLGYHSNRGGLGKFQRQR